MDRNKGLKRKVVLLLEGTFNPENEYGRKMLNADSEEFNNMIAGAVDRLLERENIHAEWATLNVIAVADDPEN